MPVRTLDKPNLKVQRQWDVDSVVDHHLEGRHHTPMKKSEIEGVG